VDTESGIVSLSPLLVIVGPTGVGKTALSLRLAKTIGGEIVSADSRLFFRGMDIGTAKPTLAERSSIPHHLIDICDPDERITLATYQRRAYATIQQIHTSMRIPILVGGTGQYVWAVVQGWGIPAVPPQAKLRRILAGLGEEQLNQWLVHLDPLSAESIDPRNIRRVIRALEVTLVTGRRMSQLQSRKPPDYQVQIIGLTAIREYLYDKADMRVDQMMAHGLLDEVIDLVDKGYGSGLSSMSGLGYRQLLAYLAGESTLDESVERIKYETHRFIRQQSTWFRPDNKEIRWFDVTAPGWQEGVEKFITAWLSGIAKIDSLVDPE